MAAIHFLVFPTTDEVFTWHVVETKTNQIISRHRNLRLALDKAKRLNIGLLPRRCSAKSGKNSRAAVTRTTAICIRVLRRPRSPT